MAAKQDVGDMIGAMPLALRGCYDEVRRALETTTHDGILARHKSGGLLADLLDSADVHKYGKGAARKLSRALDVPTQELYRWRLLHESFSVGDLRKLIARRTASERRITWSHLDVLLRVPVDKLRVSLLEQIFRDDLNVKELSAIIRDKLGKRGEAAGRKKLAPKTLQGVVAVLDRKLQDLNEFYVVATEKIEQAISQPSDNVFDDYATAIDSVTQQRSAAVAAITDMTTKLAKADGVFKKLGRLKASYDDPPSAAPVVKTKKLAGPKQAAAKLPPAKPAAPKKVLGRPRSLPAAKVKGAA